jgi:hypothetical protein
MKKLVSYLIYLFITAITFISCDSDNKEVLDMSGDVDIHSFGINGVEGIINPENSTISVILQTGTDLTTLTPQIILGAESNISPASGVTIDFSSSAVKGSEVVYTVTNADLYQRYKVSVDMARAKITKFRIGAVEGAINEAAKAVALYLPVGTDVTALIPVVEYTEGATITPADGAAVDFTNPVRYKLNYLGSEFIYTVTVNLGEPPVPFIVIYNGEDICPQWAGIAGVVESPYVNPKTDGINTSSLCASILRNGADTDDGGKAWSGGALWNSYKVNIDPAKYNRFSLLVLKEVAGDVQLEIQSDGEQNKDWLKVWYGEEHLGEWVELVFQIPDGRTAVINNILVAPHCHDAGQPVAFPTQRMYWDNLKALPK